MPSTPSETLCGAVTGARARLDVAGVCISCVVGDVDAHEGFLEIAEVVASDEGVTAYVSRALEVTVAHSSCAIPAATTTHTPSFRQRT